MRNAPCTPLTPEEEAALMNAFPASLTPEEQEGTAELFQSYVFYESLPNRSRDCWCTSCRNWFNVPRRGNADFFRASHKGVRSAMKSKAKAACPECGADSVLIAANKFTNFHSLCEHRLVVRLSAWDGWLLAQAGVVIRKFERDDYGCVTEERRFQEFRRFTFKPGRRNEWNLVWNLQTVTRLEWIRAGAVDFLPGGCHTRAVGSTWRAAQSVGEAHYPAPYQQAFYHIISPDALERSDMRYCRFFEWFDAEYGACEDKARYHAHFMRYLSEYTRRPQMEFLVKLGYEKVISGLLLDSRANRDLLNWKAANPAAFFKMSKVDFRMFHEACCELQDLKHFHALKGKGLLRDMCEFLDSQRRFEERFNTFCAACEKANVSLRRGAAYVTATAIRISPPHAEIGQGELPKAPTSVYLQEAIVTWNDYLDDALWLRYDLTRDDVRMPKDLPERHDNAHGTVRAEIDEARTKQYRSLYPKLKRRYEYSEDGLEIVVPTCAQDIIREGKILRHCVGGYAGRHIEGKLSILFLRREEEPDTPYVTIEMTVDNNPRNLKMVQIHGYRKEWDAALRPEEKHHNFLNHWLEWVRNGSPRDDDGQPVTEEAERVRVLAETRL